MLFVTNNSDLVIKGRHLGQDYEFKPKQRVAIEELTAEHLFGYGLDNKNDAYLRLGWQGPEPELAKRLAQLSFQEAKMEITPIGHAA